MKKAATPLAEKINPPNVLSLLFGDDGMIPNSRFPLLIHQGAVQPAASDPAGAFEDLFAAHGWTGSWRNGIYTYHHYHSTAHEVLGVFRGSATVQFGGEQGSKLKVHPGDVIIIPAGVAHKNLGASSDFGVVGAYPDGQGCDMNYGQPQERPRADDNIARVSLPETDPVYGAHGPLLKSWLI
jgi:uncharacterized protein YjlB